MDEIKVGDKVAAGKEGTEDYDTGTVVAVDGDQVTVAWTAGVRTTQSADLLRVIG